MNILGEINESRSDPQLRTKVRYLTDLNGSLVQEISDLKKTIGIITASSNHQVNDKADQSFDNMLQIRNKRIEELENQLDLIRKINSDLLYKNFVASQVAEYVKVIEADLIAFYESRMADFKFRLENLIEKIKEMELLKSIPLGTHQDIKYFLITKNVS
jgi:hypothetical protein